MTDEATKSADHEERPAEPQAPRSPSPAFRLGFMKFVVADLARSVAFYEAALGLSVLREIETAAVRETVLGCAEASGTRPLLVLVEPREATAPISLGNAHGALGLFTHDVDASYHRAVGAGATPYRPPFAVGTGRVAFVRDLDGREIEFLAL